MKRRAALALALLLPACGGSEPAFPPQASAPTVVIAAASAEPGFKADAVCLDESIAVDPEAKRGSIALRPAVMKASRVEACYWGTLSLEAAGESYLGSLGGDAPSASKLPIFPADPTTGLQNPYEHMAQACALAAGMAEPTTLVDETLSTYAPLALNLAKDIATATLYYKNEEFKQDGFAAGTALHARLVEGLGKLVGLRARFGAALRHYENERPGSACAGDPIERAALRCVETARSALRARLTPSFAVRATFDESIRCARAMRRLSFEHPAAIWPNLLTGTLNRFAWMDQDHDFATGALRPQEKIDLSEAYVMIVEARLRALTHTAIARAAKRATPSP